MHIEKRCHHCGQRYRYTASGPGCQNKVNNDRYCRGCQGEILVTLRKIPIRVKRIWVPVEDPTVEKCLAWEKEWDAEANYTSRTMSLENILYDMNDPDNHNYIGLVQGRGEFEGQLFRFDTWSKKPGKNTVRVAMEWNMTTGDKTVFWRDLA